MSEEQNTRPAPASATLPPVLQELDAMRLVWVALEPLAPAARVRVLAWAGELTGLQVVGDVTRDSPVMELCLPVALLSRLDNASIETVGDLADMSKTDMRRVNGVGQKFIAIIESRLDAAGFRWAADS